MKFVCRAASLEEEVFEALMVVKVGEIVKCSFEYHLNSRLKVVVKSKRGSNCA